MRDATHAGSHDRIPNAYRTDIDGLRAVAVLSVVLFHAFPKLVPGGFVGVDIFFVISGFLITRILLDEIKNDRFSIAAFYERRVRRIFPALITVLAFVCVAGWFILFPDELRKLAGDVVAGALFVANLRLWADTGYFDRSAAFKPLLHLWSLGVEEQFYIVWPLLLAMAHKKRRVLEIAATLFVISFVINIVLSKNHPASDFYSPASRFWELMAGSILACWRPSGLHQARSLASLIGAALIAVSVVFINESRVFPGWWAALPVAGATLIIAAGKDALINRFILSLRPAVWLGKISYPLYLWHWPLLAFSTVLAKDTPDLHVRITLVVLSVLLAWATYALIENPIRFKMPRGASIALPCAILLCIAGTGVSAQYAKHLPGGDRVAQIPDPATASEGDGHQFAGSECGPIPSSQKLLACATDSRDPPAFVMWGDSKADVMSWGFIRNSTPGNRWRLMTRPGCVPATAYETAAPNGGGTPEDCLHASELAMQSIIEDPHVKGVAIVAAARVLAQQLVPVGSSTIDPNAAEKLLVDDIEKLERAGKRVMLIVDNPTLPDPKQCMERQFVHTAIGRPITKFVRGSQVDPCVISYASHMQESANYRAMLANVHRLRPEVLIFDPTPILCDIDTGVCPISRDGKFLYSYGDHVSDYSNGMIARAMNPEIDAFMRQSIDSPTPMR
ncbi:peptidoglycan/LPS O-acetylase OafA/YrhL [Paraburkholderia tropica]|uniref:acyltransferase family protein n=1 Tax=Paraburkholderia tropica TaxID=92647 RepID=UPI00161F5344|nr:acyltransferase family protein [Paraburkholderia tropica]MBB3000802.1 peptidoglycan/LPS O-acetylase OafA/YrhL [Paraburkholderia tropica]MBB6319410.1 peptidoglycan/LPS O-acetylase OafA/YrhL [Paraburkholderia tropica]